MNITDLSIVETVEFVDVIGGRCNSSGTMLPSQENRGVEVIIAPITQIFLGNITVQFLVNAAVQVSLGNDTINNIVQWNQADSVPLFNFNY
ncbi:hypothetical protein [Anabaena sp. CCY 0017]|uniref:hypothetical protein n=1 Tax=Anabaena sp. CCY 0017 TaxID=3103866 RepID=UPI0039C70F03